MGVWIETLSGMYKSETSYVTPFVGVWIETFRVAHSEKWVESHPSWVCGLKHNFADCSDRLQDVTPFVGVWIETDVPLRECSG